MCPSLVSRADQSWGEHLIECLLHHSVLPMHKQQASYVLAFIISQQGNSVNLLYIINLIHLMHTYK